MGGTCELNVLSRCLGGSPAEDEIPGPPPLDHDSRSRPESGFDTRNMYRLRPGSSDTGRNYRRQTADRSGRSEGSCQLPEVTQLEDCQRAAVFQADISWCLYPGWPRTLVQSWDRRPDRADPPVSCASAVRLWAAGGVVFFLPSAAQCQTDYE